ncbi:hypothetical protein ACHAQA_007168 [Verticillium albo-atrum]
MAQPPVSVTSDRALPKDHVTGMIDHAGDVGHEGTGKRKHSSKSGAPRGPTSLTRSRGTGFETYYADPPMTPEEALEESEELYSPRIEECIQRYRARRRLNAELTGYFNRYLFLGGIDTSPRQFTGAGPNAKANPDFEAMDADDLRRATAIDMIHRSKSSCKFYNEAEHGHWEVDFTGIVAGFLSETVPEVTNQNYAAMNKAVSVVENFLRYILHHDVCPEYGTDVRSALALCQKSRVDLPRVHHALISFPGEFNLAAGELFCDDHLFSPRDAIGAFKRPDGFDARTVFTTGILLAGTDAQIDKLLSLSENLTSIKVKKQEYRDLEVVLVNRPSAEIRQQYKAIRLGPVSAAMQPLGVGIFKSCIVEDGFDIGEIAAAQPPDETEQRFLLDDHILYFLRPGMKVRATVCELTSGFTFIKTVSNVLVPWFVYLPQKLMRQFKQPTMNDRPAPSVRDVKK